MIEIRKLEISEVIFSITCLEEYMPIRGNVCCSGDSDYDRKIEDMIIKNSEWNPWAWCAIRVTANWNNLIGEDYLGGCSYENERDFILNSGYYEDMKQFALDDLNNKVNNYFHEIGQLIYEKCNEEELYD